VVRTKNGEKFNKNKKMAKNRPKIEIAKKREKTAYFLADSRFFCHKNHQKVINY
jgi:hypothetical protein